MSASARRALQTRLVIVTVATAVISSCGYRSSHAGREGFAWCQAAAGAQTQSRRALLASGVRDGLSAVGALGDCPPSQRVRVEVVRITSSPLAAVQGEGGAVARGLTINVVGRATAEVEGGVRTIETEGETTIEASQSATSAAQTEKDARALASRLAGQRLAARLAGLPNPSQARESSR